MAMDSALETAIKQAVAECGQPGVLAERLIAWIAALSEGDLPPEQLDGFHARLIGAVSLAGADDED